MAEQTAMFDSREVVSYRYIKVMDVIKSFNWRELSKDIEDMLTKSRVDTMERDYNLIDSPCNAKIKANLMNRDPAVAARILLEYFEKNHNGDDLLRFCNFLRDESEEVGRSTVLEDLADRIERAVKDLGAPQASYDRIQRAISDSLEKGAVEVNVIKCVTMGPPEAGKTQLKRALLGDFTEADTSTPASTQATPAVDLMVPGEKKWEHLDFDRLQAAVKVTVKERKFVQKPSWDNSSNTNTNQRSDSKEHSHTDNQSSRLPERNMYFHDLNEEILKTMADSKFHDRKIDIQKARLIYMVDSGGQPSFLDFHPVTATFAATYLLVYNMEEGLDTKPKMTYRKPRDYPTRNLPDSTQSNLEILRRSLVTLYHFQPRYHEMHERLAQLMKNNFKKPADKPPIIVVGTRRNQSTEEDEDRLQSIYEQIPPMEEMTTNCFVDSRMPNSTEIQELRHLVCDDDSTCFFRLPLSWFRLHLMSLALGSGEAIGHTLQALTFSDLLDMCLKENLVSSDVELEAMVTVFHSLGVFSCPDLELPQGLEDSLVFTNPNLLFGYVTKILEIPFRVLPKAGKRSLSHLQLWGELTTNALKELDIPDTLGSYQGFHKRLLVWLVHWGLAAEIEQEEKWFIPSVLPPKPITFHTSINENPFPPFPLSISFLQESSHDFTFHYLPEGFFPHFVVKLMQAGYTLAKNNPSKAKIPRCRDAIFIIRHKDKFNAKITFNISLIDESTHLSVNLYPADRSAPNARQEAGAVLAELKHKVEKTNESLYHRTNDRIAICCPCPCSSKEGRLRDQHIARVDPGDDGSIGITCLHPRRPQMGSWEGTSTDEVLNEVISGFHSKSGVKKGRKRSPQHGSSSSKRKEPSSDSEKSDFSASSELSEDKTKIRGSKSTKRGRSYSEVTVRDVIRGMTREKLHSGIKNMLMEHRTNLLCDDWELINEECRDDILGDLKANNKTKAADRLIDYFDNNHTGEELLHFCDFLTKEAKDGGRNPKLLKLAKSIKEAVHDVSSGPSGASK